VGLDVVGFFVGSPVDGMKVGPSVASLVGLFVGSSVGPFDGFSVGL